MEDTNSDRESSTGRQSKVDRLIGKYDLDGIGAEMEHRWTADNEERRSLRDLADYFNRRLLAESMSEAGHQLLDGEEENLYRLLTEDNVSSADETRARRRVERAGIDIEDLLDDFVSYQSIRRYLVKDRGIEHSPTDSNRTERTEENIQRLRNRTRTVTESRVEQLRQAGVLSIGDSFRTIVDIRIICEDCGSQFDVQELLDRGRCNCS